MRKIFCCDLTHKFAMAGSIRLPLLVPDQVLKAVEWGMEWKDNFAVS
jgi:hypothetical protein